MKGVKELFKNLPTTKEDGKKLEDQFAKLATSGDFDPLDLLVKINNLSKITAAVLKRKDVKEEAFAEMGQYTEKEVTKLGAKLVIAKAGVKYDFVHCGHPTYNSIIDKIEKLNEQRKQLEKELKPKQDFFIFVDPDTGETAECNPPLCTYTDTIKVTLS